MSLPRLTILAIIVAPPLPWHGNHCHVIAVNDCHCHRRCHAVAVTWQSSPSANTARYDHNMYMPARLRAML